MIPETMKQLIKTKVYLTAVHLICAHTNFKHILSNSSQSDCNPVGYILSVESMSSSALKEMEKCFSILY